jgi:hypothetical protein
VKIYVANESTVVSDAELRSALPAFQQQCWQVKGWWGKFALLELGLPPKGEEAWQIVLLDDSDQAGALGYHDYTPGGRPISKVFTKTDQQYGYSWTVTLSHELCEMLVDPWINQLAQVSDTDLYALEVGDPVEADDLGYKIDGILVSDFVLPYWFVPGAKGQFDFRGHCDRPLQVLPGGYMSVFVSGEGWTQIDANGGRVPLNAKGDHSRPVKYGRPR